MSAGKVYAACTILETEKLLIAAGGNSIGWDKTDSVEIYSFETETWTSAGPMPILAYAVAEGEFLFTWGDQKLHQYEPKSDEWMEIESPPFNFMKLRRSSILVAVENENICSFV